MNKIFDSVWALRIIALVLASALFFYVKSDLETGREAVGSDQVDILYNVPLEVYYDNEELLVTGLPEAVNITISGKSALIRQTKMEQDYVVFVDLNALTVGEHHVPVRYENFPEELNVSIDPASVNIIIEEKVSKELRVEPEMNHRLIAEDFILKEMTANPNTVTITGAKSIIESISYVKATVTAEQGINASFEQEANVKVLNSELNRLDVVVEPEKVKVQVEIEEYSKEIPITIKETGKLAEGISINELSSDPKKLKVTGKKAIIDGLTELVVKFDVSELAESGTYEAKVTVPEGVTVSSEKVKIYADINQSIASNNEKKIKSP